MYFYDKFSIDKHESMRFSKNMSM